MQLKEIFNLVDRIAPFALSEENCIKYGHYDNSGLILDCGKNIKGILFTLDLCTSAIEEAKRVGANCIITHHPAIWHGVEKLSEGGKTDLIVKCIQQGISVISAHLNLDVAPNGIDEWLMRGLGGKEAIAVMETFEGGAYGRVFEVKENSLNVFTEKTKQVFHSKRVITYGNAPVKKIACFCGGGFDEKSLAFALANGADTIVSSDAKHHLIRDAVENGMNVVLLTHYAAENYGFLRFAETVRQNVKISVTTFADERYL